MVGRPPKGAEKLVPRSVRLTAAEHDAIDRIARREGMTPAEYRRVVFQRIIRGDMTKQPESWKDRLDIIDSKGVSRGQV